MRSTVSSAVLVHTRTASPATGSKVTLSTMSEVAGTVATVRQAPAVRICSSYGASGRASSQVSVAWPSVGVPASRTVRAPGVAGSVPGVQAVTMLPSTAATAGALGSAAFAVPGRQGPAPTDAVGLENLPRR